MPRLPKPRRSLNQCIFELADVLKEFPMRERYVPEELSRLALQREATTVLHMSIPIILNMLTRVIAEYSSTEDLFQVGCLAVVHAVETYNGESAFATWASYAVLRAMQEEARSQVIRQPRLKAVSKFEPLGILEYQPRTPVADSLELLDVLKPRHRDIFYQWLCGWTQKELAPKYRVSSARIGQILLQCRKKVRRAAKDRGKKENLCNC